MAHYRIKALSKHFGSVEALKAVSFELEKAERLALIGPTGAGKSVLLKCLLGLYAVDAGSVFFGDANVGASLAARADKHKMAMLFQHNALFDSMSVWENIAFGLLRAGLPRDAARAQAERLMAKVGLKADVADLGPDALSGGMQKRVGFARAIAGDAKFLLLDNPTAGLDPILARRVESMILRLSADAGATVITVTADMARVCEQYDKIAVLHDGVLRWFGRGADARADKNPWLQQLLSGSREGPIEVATAA